MQRKGERGGRKQRDKSENWKKKEKEKEKEKSYEACRPEDSEGDSSQDSISHT